MSGALSVWYLHGNAQYAHPCLTPIQENGKDEGFELMLRPVRGLGLSFPWKELRVKKALWDFQIDSSTEVTGEISSLHQTPSIWLQAELVQLAQQLLLWMGTNPALLGKKRWLLSFWRSTMRSSAFQNALTQDPWACMLLLVARMLSEWAELQTSKPEVERPWPVF